jgi:hypothetical protein
VSSRRPTAPTCRLDPSVGDRDSAISPYAWPNSSRTASRVHRTPLPTSVTIASRPATPLTPASSGKSPHLWPPRDRSNKPAITSDIRRRDVWSRRRAFSPLHPRASRSGAKPLRLDRRHAHECRQSYVNVAKLMAVALEIGPEQGVSFAIERFYVLEASVRGICSPRTRCSLGSMRCASIATVTSLRTAFSTGCKATSASAPRTTCMSY